MRLVKTFRSAEYAAIRERSESLAFVWGMGHVFFVVFVALALAMPFAVALAVMIDPEDTRHRAWDVTVAGVGAMLIIAAIGFAVRWYASKKARRMTDSP